ncbi:MAG TPA: delta-60 repeat domain-containing protein [Opitutaceae bacterium]
MPLLSTPRNRLHGLLMAGVVLAGSLGSISAARAVTSANDGFDPNANGNVNSIVVQPDGKILMGGYFTVLQPFGESATSTPYLARVNHDGTVDTSFSAATNDVVRTVGLQPNGQILLGGNFSAVTPTGSTTAVTRNYTARLNADGTLDPTFNPNPNGVVYAMVWQPNGQVIIGGAFTTVQPAGASAPITRNHIARFNVDGSLDTSFDPNPDKTVLALAVEPNGQVIIGGGFATLTPNGAASATTRSCLARVNSDGSLDTGFDPEPNGSVDAILVLPNSQIVIGGEFVTVQPNGTTGAVQCDFLARLDSDGSLDGTYIINPLQAVSAVAAQPDGRLIIGGTFSQVYPANNLSPVPSAYVARINTDGSVDTSFIPSPNQAVNTIAIEADGNVLLGGYFTSVQPEDTASPTLRNHVARVNTYGVPDSSVAPDSTGSIFATATLSNGQTLIGGTFLSVGGTTANFLARLNADGSLDTSFKATVNGPVQAISVLPSGQIVIGGSFSTVDGTGRGNIARLNSDGTLDGIFNPNTNSNVIAIAQVPNNQILIGGSFSLLAPNGSTTGYSVSSLARINSDGSLDLTYNPSPNGSVFTIAIDGDGKTLIGGGFTSIGTVTRSYAARLLPNGSIDTAPFDPEPNLPVYAIAIQSDKKILIGGSFTALVPQTAKAGTVTTAYNNPYGSQTVLPAPGASATTPIYINHLARINTDGSMDTTFFPDPSSDVLSIGLQSNGAMVIGGILTSFAPNGGTVGTVRNYIGRVNSDGSLDQGFNPNANQLVDSITVLSNQNLLVAGAFTTLQPNGAATTSFVNHVAILNADGTVNSSFNVGSGSSVSGQVRAFAQQPNGPVIVGGSFSPLAGSPAPYLIRLNGDASVDTSYNSGADGTVNAVAVLPTGAATSIPSNAAVWLNSNGLVRYSYSAASNGEVVCSAVDAQGRVLVGGLFSSFGGVSGLQNLVRLNTDGSVDTTFAPTPDEVVNAIVIQADGKIVIGGGFTTVDGITNAYLARLNADGSLDTAYAPQPNLEVLALALESDGKIVAGGDFNQMIPTGATTAAAVNFIARLNTDGSVDTTFNPDLNGPAYTIAFNSKGQVIVGGSFSAITPNAGSTSYTVQNLARLNTNGTVDTAFYPDPNAAVSALLVLPNDQVIAAGTFTAWEQNANITGVTPGNIVTSNYITRVNTDGTVDTSFAPNPNGGLVAIALQPNGQIILGGNFTALQPNRTGIPAERSDIARINADGTIDPGFDPSLNGDADSISVLPDGSLFVGGNFTSVQVGGAVLIGGSFANVGGQPAPNLARLNADGSLDSSFLANADGPVNAIAPLISGESLVGGSFTHVEGQSQPGLAEVTAAGTFDSGFAPAVSGTVNSIAVQANGQPIIGGSFTSVGGQSHPNLARLTASGALDSSFAASVNGTVNAVFIQANGKVLIGGSFTAVDGQAMANLARVNADGSLDGTFNPAPSGTVNAIETTVDGTIYVGGAFTTIGGQAIPYAAHLAASGAVDPAFQPDPNAEVNAVMVQPDGKVLLGGAFTSAGGSPHVEIARFAALSPVDSTLSASIDQTTFTWTRTGSAPSFSAVRFEETTDGTHWLAVGQGRTSDGITWQLSGAVYSGSPLLLVRATGIEPSTQFASAGVVQQLYLADSTAIPQINSASSLSVTNGVPVDFTVTATQSSNTFKASGLPPGLSISSAGVISGTPTTNGTYNVTLTVSNSGGSTSSGLTIVVSSSNGSSFTAAPGSAANRLLNLSSRADLPGSQVLITGFAISGTGTKSVLLRAVGPGLAQFDVADTMATPTIELIASDGTLISQNSGWGGSSSLSTVFQQVGAFALTSGSADAVILADLQPGSYTVHVFDPSARGGVVLAEVYDASASPMTATQRLVNISSRGTVSPGAGALIGGFVISGSSVKSVLIRGIGPGLVPFGVTDAIKDPVLSVFDALGNVVAQNLNWTSQSITGAEQASVTSQDIANVGASVGAFALTAGSADTALIANLPPGAYTFQVTSASNATGEALGEVYEVQ